MATHHLRQGDTAPVFRTRLQAPDSNGVLQNVDLSGSTVRFHARNHADKVVKVDALAVADPDQSAGGNRGYVEWTPTAADTDIAGRFDCEWEVTFPGGTIQTFPTRGVDVLRIYGEIVA